MTFFILHQTHCTYPYLTCIYVTYSEMTVPSCIELLNPHETRRLLISGIPRSDRRDCPDRERNPPVGRRKRTNMSVTVRSGTKGKRVWLNLPYFLLLNPPSCLHTVFIPSSTLQNLFNALYDNIDRYLETQDQLTPLRQAVFISEGPRVIYTCEHRPSP